MIKLVKERVCQCRVGDESTCHRFHANETHVVLVACLHNLLVFLRRKVREGILERIVAILLDGFHGYGLAMVADANETNFALTFGHLHGIIQPLLIAWTRTIIGVVELVKVKIIGL